MPLSLFPRQVFFVFLLLVAGLPVYAHHGKGGTIMYQYLGAGTSSGTSKYLVTVQHYINCERIGDEPNQIYLGIFDAGTDAIVTTITIAQTSKTEITKKYFNPCINPDPTVCYYLVTYVTTIIVNDNANGYTLTEQDCCRADEIVNISNPSSTGFSNYNTIPGIINGVVYRNNSSPTLIFKDTSVICHSSSFSIDMGATDADGDKLSYAFCGAKGTGSSDRQPNPPSAPPYPDVTYANGYSGGSPMGSGVTINPSTGLISGIAPATTGDYAITVCITETRNGVIINVTKKEVLVTVADCSLSAATLGPSYINCDNFTFTFKNLTTSTLASTYHWDFGVPGTNMDTSSLASPVYTYADTGVYILKLKVSNSSGCEDSTSAPVKVYPGFRPGFTFSGSCYQSPFVFTDISTAKYGIINGWDWDFGDLSTSGDSSHLKNPSYSYPVPASVTVQLTVTSSKGCTGTASKTVVVNGKPDIELPFTDTLICSIDTLPLIVKSTDGTAFQWSPLYNLINPATTNPLVYPKQTTRYTVTVTDKGCTDTGSVNVRVLDFITATLTPDTTICRTDAFTLNPVSQGLQYQWTPATGLSNPTVKYPVAAPFTDITYDLLVHLGKCTATASETVHVAPYPLAEAGADTSICSRTFASLSGTITASHFSWTPAGTLMNAGSLTPTAYPFGSTTYYLTVTDTLGCPKAVTDSVVVTVIPEVNVFAGNDTSIVVGEPLALSATATGQIVSWIWTPLTGMNDGSVPDPTITISDFSVDSIRYYLTAATKEGCSGTDNLLVKIYKTLPDLFMPNAFTPNGDGKNDLYRPVPVGIFKTSYFRIYNRWGQLVYKTTVNGAGWNGELNGHQQDPGTYVYMVAGTDYTGKTILKKGTFELIR